MEIAVCSSTNSDLNLNWTPRIEDLNAIIRAALARERKLL